MLEAVVNVSEGRDPAVVEAVRDAAGPTVLDVHRDADHHRSVFTLAGPDDAVEAGVRQLASAAVTLTDLTTHRGAHPRIGSLDVVPFVAVDVVDGRVVDGDITRAKGARDRFAGWAASALGLPCFVYGPPPAPTLPELRRSAWRSAWPDLGPRRPHPSAGAACVGARPVLVAYNLWLEQPDVAAARRIAAGLRSPEVRALGLEVGDKVQVSCNLIAPWTVGPAVVHDRVASETSVAAAELVGLLPAALLADIPPARWGKLDVGPERTLEARLEKAGLDGGRFDGWAAPGCP